MREKFIPSRCPPILNVMGGIKILPVKDIPHDTFILFYNFFNSKFELKVAKLWDKVNFDNEMSFFLSSISLGSAVTNTLFSFCVLAVPQTKYLHGPIRTRAEYWELRYHSDLTSSVVLASSFVSVALVHSPNTSCKILTAGVDASNSSCTCL